MQKVVFAGSLPEAAGARLRGRYYIAGPTDAESLGRELADADGLLALLTLRVDDALLARAPKLRVVGNFAVGTDNIDLAACTRRGIAVTNTPDVLTETTADLAFALLLAAARRIPEADRYVRARRWHGGFERDLLVGVDVFKKTLGIVGLGRIGGAVARRAEGFGMEVIYAAPRPVVGVPYRCVALPELLAVADFVSLHCPLTETTRHLIGAAELRLLKPGAVLVNTARGPLIDEAALASWVAAGGRAGLDVFEREPAIDPELLASERVVVSPHIGSATAETRARMATLAADGIDDVLSGRRPAHLVNPDVLL
jgi:glyoxylate reductase